MSTELLLQLALLTQTKFISFRYCCFVAAVFLYIPVSADIYAVHADYETTPVVTKGDAADDPAIWVNHSNPAKSLVFGTDKKSGIYVYSIKGKEIAYRAFGNINNIDLRQINDTILLAGTNRTTQEVVVWKFSTHELNNLSKSKQLPDPFLVTKSDINIYGLCMGLINNQIEIFVTEDMGPNVQIWSVSDNSLELKTTFSNYGESEGCVVDDYHQKLFISEEESAGVMRSYNLNNAYYLSETIIDSREGNIGGDPEGIALYQSSASEGYIILSSQGDSKYNIYNRTEPHAYLGSFRIVGNNKIDGASDTDGLEVANFNLSKKFSSGIIVVQDGFNTDGNKVKNQNFKIVSFDKVLERLQR